MSRNKGHVYPRKTCNWCRRKVDARRFKDGSRRCQRCVDALVLAREHDIKVTRGEGARRCCSCREIKRFSPEVERSDFCVTRNRAASYNVRCKECELKRVVEYTRAYPEGKRRREARYRERVRQDPEAYAQQLAMWRASHRKHYQRIRQDPERWAEVLANNRIYYHIKAEREGRKVTRLVRVGVNGGWTAGFGNNGEALPEAPLRAWLEAVILCKGNDLDFVMLGRELGVDERQLHSIRRAEYSARQLSLADRMLTRFERPIEVPGYGTVWRIEDLWPVELGEELAA